MNIIKGDLLTINDSKYITLEILKYDGDDYAFVGKVTNDDEITDEFYIFKLVGNNIEIVANDNLKNILITRFEELLKEDIKNITSEL